MNDSAITQADMVVMSRAMASALQKLAATFIRVSEGKGIPVPLEMTAEMYESMGEWVRSAEHLEGLLTHIADVQDAAQRLQSEGKGTP